jgi:hypothetical protein
VCSERAHIGLGDGVSTGFTLLIPPFTDCIFVLEQSRTEGGRGSFDPPPSPARVQRRPPAVGRRGAGAEHEPCWPRVSVLGTSTPARVIIHFPPVMAQRDWVDACNQFFQLNGCFQSVLSILSSLPRAVVFTYSSPFSIPGGSDWLR